MTRHPLLLLTLLLSLTLSSASADRLVTLTFTGDVTLGGEVQYFDDPTSFTGYYERYGADYFLQNFRTYFEADDLTVINLEGPLTDSSAQ